MPQTCHRPTTEEAARFLSDLRGSIPPSSWLTSMLYLADRHHILTYGHSLADDRFTTLNGIPIGVGTNRIAAAMAVDRSGRSWRAREIEHLSVVIEDTLRTVYQVHGHRTPEELHNHLRTLPEAAKTGPFTFRQLGELLGDPDPGSLHHNMETSRAIRWCFDDLRCRLHSGQAA